MTPSEERINAVAAAISLAYEHSEVHKNGIVLLGGLLPKEMAKAAIAAADATRPEIEVTDAMINACAEEYDKRYIISDTREVFFRALIEAAPKEMS